jgi:hypothetical protein
MDVSAGHNVLMERLGFSWDLAIEIYRHLTPNGVCAMSCVSQLCNLIGNKDEVWQKYLARNISWQTVLDDDDKDKLSQLKAKKEVFKQFAQSRKGKYRNVDSNGQELTALLQKVERLEIQIGRNNVFGGMEHHFGQARLQYPC